MPKCTENNCTETNPSNFYLKSGTKTRYTSKCKYHHNKSKTVINRLNKQSAIEYKGGKCSLCNYSKCLGALEFHHIDPKQKDPNYSSLKNRHFSFLKNELDKCILVCSNCHREIHAGLHPSILNVEV